CPLYVGTSLLVYFYCPPRDLPSSPTRRSSDLRWEHPTTDGRLHARVIEPSGDEPDVIVVMAGGVTAVDPHTGESTRVAPVAPSRSEEHTSELQSRENLVCRLLLEKKKQKKQQT